MGANVGRCWIHFSCCIFVFGDFHVFLLNSAFLAFHKTNQGLEVSRETRLETWEYHPTIREEKSSYDVLTFREGFFGLNKSQMDKIRVLAQGVDLLTKSGCCSGRWI